MKIISKLNLLNRFKITAFTFILTAIPIMIFSIVKQKDIIFVIYILLVSFYVYFHDKIITTDEIYKITIDDIEKINISMYNNENAEIKSIILKINNKDIEIKSYIPSKQDYSYMTLSKEKYFKKRYIIEDFYVSKALCDFLDNETKTYESTYIKNKKLIPINI